MLNRREFLLGVGGGLSLVGLGQSWGCSRRVAEAPLVLANREESWANSICELCPSGCGLRLRLVNGHPVTVGGNPLHPVNRGGLCARGAASLQVYYDPDRFAGPLRRDPSVIGGWAPVSWDVGLKSVGDGLRAAAGGGRVAVIRGEGSDIATQLWGRLVRACDSRWVIDVKAPADRAMDEVVRRMHGTSGRLVYDLENAEVLFSVDSGVLEASPRMMTLHRGFADMRSAGGYFVHAGPRLGVTGGKADEWVPIRPGTAGIFALGVAHVLIKEGYARQEFLRDHVAGYEDWTDAGGVQRTGTRSWILHEFSPQRVAERTGADWAQIIRVARRFGSARRPLAVGPVQGDSAFQTFDALAVHVLNAVAGAIDVPGGVLVARRMPFEDLDAAPATGSGAPTVEEFADLVLQAASPPVDVCFVHDTDPVFTSPQGEKIAAALKKIPLVVSTAAVLDDTAAQANVILPASLWVERQCDSVQVDGHGYPVVSLSPAAARPRADTRNPADVAIALAKSVGGRPAQQFPWQNYDEVLRARVQALYASGVGDTFSGQHRSTWTQLLERSGWRAVDYDSVPALEAKMAERGGWWDPAYYHGEWRRVAAFGENRIDLQPVQLPVDSLPASTIEGHDERLLLYVYPELSLSTRLGGSIPYLQDLGSPLWQSSWETGAELNDRTAQRLGLASGDRVRIGNDHGEIAARVRVSPGIRPDVVAVHSGGGRKHGGRFAARIGSNPLPLIRADEDGGGRRESQRPALVRVTREA